MEERGRNLAIREWQDKIKAMTKAEIKALSQGLMSRLATIERSETLTINKATHAAGILRDLPSSRIAGGVDPKLETIEEIMNMIEGAVNELALALVDLGDRPD